MQQQGASAAAPHREAGLAIGASRRAARGACRAASSLAAASPAAGGHGPAAAKPAGRHPRGGLRQPRFHAQAAQQDAELGRGAPAAGAPGGFRQKSLDLAGKQGSALDGADKLLSLPHQRLPFLAAPWRPAGQHCTLVEHANILRDGPPSRLIPLGLLADVACNFFIHIALPLVSPIDPFLEAV